MLDTHLLAITTEEISTRFISMQKQLEATLSPELRESLREALNHSTMACSCESCGNSFAEHTVQSLHPMPPEVATCPNDTLRGLEYIHGLIQEAPVVDRHLHLVLSGLTTVGNRHEAAQILCYLFSMAFYLGHTLGTTHGPELPEFDHLFQQARPKEAQ